MDEEKDSIEINENEGAIVIREDADPEIYAPVTVGDISDSIRFTLAYLLYAAEKDEWIKEFRDFIDKFNSQKESAVASIRRAQFEVIDGDKE